jgi:hypothetical protein
VREQTPAFAMLLSAMVIETVAADLLLRHFHAPGAVRAVILGIDVYGILVGLAVMAACATRPHVVGEHELRIRYGAFFDLRIPRELVGPVRLARNYNEPGLVSVEDGTLAAAVSSQTNLIAELTAPVIAVRPLGRRAEVHTVRFFADDPAAALAALTSPVGKPPVRDVR